MIHYSSTARLKVYELKAEHGPFTDALLETIPRILTKNVVENLPPYFQGIESKAQAKAWLDIMLAESRLFLVKNKNEEVLGCVFISYAQEQDNYQDKHLGYLLAEEQWGKGLASELLHAFIKHAEQAESWHKLIGGVDKHNFASAKILLKLGFTKRYHSSQSVDFYELSLSKS